MQVRPLSQAPIGGVQILNLPTPGLHIRLIYGTGMHINLGV